MSEHRKLLAKLLQANAHRCHMWDVFGDFVEMAALSMRNAVDLHQRDEREQRYLSIVKKYEPDEVARFPQMLGCVIEMLEAGPCDALGSLFGELELGNTYRGQFFTPYEVCKLMADMLVDDEMRAKVKENGFITCQEPAVGAGAMVIALAESMQNAGMNYQRNLHVTAIDVDSRAVHMAYVQFSLLHIPAVLYVGNTLTLEMREAWPTPARIMGFWEHKLRRGYALETADDVEEQAPQPVVLEHPSRVQGDLFGVAA